MVMEYFDMDKFMDIGCYGDYKSSTCGKMSEQGALLWKEDL